MRLFSYEMSMDVPLTQSNAALDMKDETCYNSSNNCCLSALSNFKIL